MLTIYRATSSNKVLSTSQWTTWGKDISSYNLLFGTPTLIEAIGWGIRVTEKFPAPEGIWQYKVKRVFYWESSFDELIEITSQQKLLDLIAWYGIDDVGLREIVFYLEDIEEVIRVW